MANNQASSLEMLCDPAHPLQREFAALIMVLASNDPDCGKTATHAQSPQDLYSCVVAQRAMLNYAMAARDFLTPSEQRLLERLKKDWVSDVRDWSQGVQIKRSGKRSHVRWIAQTSAFTVSGYHMHGCEMLYDKACLRLTNSRMKQHSFIPGDIDTVVDFHVDKDKVVKEALELYRDQTEDNMFLFVHGNYSNKPGVEGCFNRAAQRMLARDNPWLQDNVPKYWVEAYTAHMVVEYLRLCANPPPQKEYLRLCANPPPQTA